MELKSGNDCLVLAWSLIKGSTDLILFVILINWLKPSFFNRINTLSTALFVKLTRRTFFYNFSKILIKDTIAVVFPDPGVPNIKW